MRVMISIILMVIAAVVGFFFAGMNEHRVNLPRTFITKYPPPTQRHTQAGNLKKVSCFFLPKMRW